MVDSSVPKLVMKVSRFKDGERGISPKTPLATTLLGINMPLVSRNVACKSMVQRRRDHFPGGLSTYHARTCASLKPSQKVPNGKDRIAVTETGKECEH